jgi:hypothetical protein
MMTMDNPNDPNAMMVEPAVGEEDMEAFLKSLEDSDASVNLASILQPDHSDTEESESESESESEPSEPEPTEPEPVEQPSDYFTINGEQWPRSEIERLYQFDRYLRFNPDVAQRVAEATRPRQESPAVPETAQEAPQVEFTPPQLPDFLDLDDPQQRFMWESHLATQKAIHDRDQRDNRIYAQLQQQQEQQVQRQASQDMETALDQFTDAFPNLNEDDLNRIRTDAGPLVDGMLKQLPPVQALYRSMEVAAWANADLRFKLQDPTKESPSSEQTSRTRKQRLSSISGAPKSAPKVEPRPTFTSDRDMIQQFADELAENGLGR